MQKVILLTPCYNEEQRLDAFLAALKKQTVPVDVVAIDDGSKDNSFAKLNSTNFLYVGRNTKNIGITRTMNRLYEVAKSYSPDYLTWSPVDEDLYPDAIERRLNYLRANRCDIVVTGADTQTRQGKLIYPELLPQFAWLRKADFNRLHEELLSGNFFQSPILLDMKKVSFDDLILDEKTKHFPDWDQMLTLSRKYKFGFMDEATACADWDGSNFSTPNPRLLPEKLKEFIYVLLKHLPAARKAHATGFTLKIVTKAMLRLVQYYSALLAPRMPGASRRPPGLPQSAPGRNAGTWCAAQ